MSVHMQIDLSELHRDLLSMCAQVEDMIHRAVDQLANPNLAEAVSLTERDNDIDRWDVRIENACLKILALHQPVAIDLRRITAVMKISAELERVADLAVNISERACGLLSGTQVAIPDRLNKMAERAINMLHRSIDAYVALDATVAREVCREDDDIDEMNRELIDEIISLMHRHPDQLDALLHMFSAVRQVERVADHATNIAEDVVYLIEGKIIRHARKLQQNTSSNT